MSKSSHRFNLVYQAVVATSLGVSALSAHAVNLSQANIESAQHEPLSATIEVSDIDANNFNASLASGSVYQQMGLKQDADIQVTFTRTSDTSGKITLTSKTPISKPFTDVVLNLNNNGEQVVEPQTLLMPIASNTDLPPSLTDPIMVAAEPEQNLPVVGVANSNDNQTNDKKDDEAATVLDLSAGDPLELSPLEQANLVQPSVSNEQNLATSTLDNTQSQDEGGLPLVTTNTTDTPSESDDKKDGLPQTEEKASNTIAENQAVTTPKIISQQEQVLAAITPEGSNQQINILTEQITRKVLESPEAIDAGAVPIPSSEAIAETQNKDKNTTANAAQTGETATYVVQSGDSLWGIASQIAKANNVSVMEVMNTIHAQNPDAFFNNNISRLKTKASLSLPNYKVVPSQKAIQEAMSANKNARGIADGKTSKANKAGSDKKAQTKKHVDPKKHSTHAAAGERPKANKAPAKPLPKPQMTLVSPSSIGQATGTQAKGNSGGKGVGSVGNNQLVNTLKSTRNQTAANATKVNTLNQELASATQKLQLQNQKLAELEARLKALKDK